MSQAGLLVNSGIAPGTGIQTLEGNSGGPVGPNGGGNLFVVGDGITIDIVGTPGSNTLTASVIGSGATVTLNGDIGSALLGSVFTFDAHTNSGSSVFFSADGASTISLLVTDPSSNTIMGENSGNGTLSGSENSGFGKNVLQDLTSGSGNVAMGYLALVSATSGTENISIGAGSMGTLTSGQFNTGIGADTLTSLITGNRNISLGNLSGASYVAAESNNIVIGNNGVAAENNTLRLGTNGSGNGQQNRCFVAGVDGVNVGSVATVVTEAGNQLGTAVITAGTGITITPGANTITISNSAVTPNYTNVNTTPYTVLANDYYLSVDSSGGPITLRFPNTATLSTTYVVKDRLGTAATNNITITTVGGATLIDLATTFVMNTAFESVFMIGNGTSYEIY
jgi:hypothetical protein